MAIPESGLSAAAAIMLDGGMAQAKEFPPRQRKP